MVHALSQIALPRVETGRVNGPSIATNESASVEEVRDVSPNGAGSIPLVSTGLSLVFELKLL